LNAHEGPWGPATNIIFVCKKDCYYKYKIAICKSKKEVSRETNDNLFDNLVDCDSVAFWKVWKDLDKVTNTLPPRIDGETQDGGIANAFGRHFENVYSGSDTPAHLSLKQEFDCLFHEYYSDHVDDSLAQYYSSWKDMLGVVDKIKTGKSSAGFIKPEHLLNGCTELIEHIHLLFNGMI
jgi:hypothetical protein